MQERRKNDTHDHTDAVNKIWIVRTICSAAMIFVLTCCATFLLHPDQQFPEPLERLTNMPLSFLAGWIANTGVTKIAGTGKVQIDQPPGEPVPVETVTESNEAAEGGDTDAPQEREERKDDLA
jgi:hypothetical protein